MNKKVIAILLMWLAAALCLIAGMLAGSAGYFPLILLFSVPGIGLIVFAFTLSAVEIMTWYNTLDADEIE